MRNLVITLFLLTILDQVIEVSKLENLFIRLLLTCWFLLIILLHSFPSLTFHSCDCLTGWKGAFCTETMSVCEPEHDPPHLCQQGSTCVPLPNGYTCHCPLGTTGTYCEQGMSNAKYIVHIVM